MSGLENFQTSETWRKNFKEFLFLERKPVLQKPVAVKETHRCSLDIREDLQSLLRERKREIELQKQGINSALIRKASESADNMNRPFSHFDDTCYAVPQDLATTEMVSDESFEALEKMCNKTASDPDSTLFQYLHSDHQEQILADAKKRSTGESNAIAIEEKDSDIGDPLLPKLSDCTLLDDIEAPSRMWENTLIGEAGCRTSPVKMVGLLRPSTIMEEAANESVNSESSLSSLTSFRTATKGLPSDVSSAYDTARESTSTQTDLLNRKPNEEELDVDNILQMAIERSRMMASDTPPPPRIEISEPSIVIETQNGTTSDGIPENVVGSIELGKTVSPLHNSLHSSMVGETVFDVVVIDDNDDDDDEQKESNETEEEGDDSGDEYVINILSDEEEVEDHYGDIKLEVASNYSKSSLHESYGLDENKENCSQDCSIDRSMKFNDTMEEVEYLLKKGMEYMAARDLKAVPLPTDDAKAKNEQALPIVPPTEAKSQPKSIAPLRTCRTQPNTPMSSLKKPVHMTSSVSKVKSSNFKSPTKYALSGSKRIPLDMRPFPKFDVFCGKTQVAAGHPRQKELANKQSFSHIVSPVGAYMKKTPSTPLMAKGKMKSTNINVMNSAAFRELEIESRLYQPKVGINSPSTKDRFGLSALPGVTGVPKTLPKKAYISSELKHIVDERTPFTIPGGKKIQKYLENAMMPAVLRHDGKMKFPGAPNVSDPTKEHSNPSSRSESSNDLKSHNNAAAKTAPTHRNNASLADLSVMSGDVSMYTIMDAQKF